MVIPQRRQPYFLFLLGTIICSAILAAVTLHLLYKDSVVIYQPLHSSIEGVGAMAAILMSLLLLHIHQGDERKRLDCFILSLGFLMLGILDGFHSVSTLRHGLVLLRSFANICSSFWFALLWLPSLARHASKIKYVHWKITALCIGLGLLATFCRDIFPSTRLNGNFTPFMILINLAAGMFSLAAGIKFFFEFLRYSTTESYLFACMFLLLGLSGIEYTVSGVWSYLWWLCHAEHCLAYTVVFIYMCRMFLWNKNELVKMNIHLEERIADRTAQLSAEVAERTRYAAQRDQVIAELREADARIRTLTGLLPTCASCKRIRNADGDWEQMETYIQNHSTAKFSHGLCLSCAKKLYPNIFDERVEDFGPPYQDKIHVLPLENGDLL